MKRKILAGISLTLFLTVALFIAFPAKSQFVGNIKIGAIGPMPWIQGGGIDEGCRLAAKQINDAGGIQVSGTWGGGVAGAYKVVVVSADTLRGMPDPTAATGTAAMMELASAGCDLVIGGFRTEATFGAREVAMDNQMIYVIAGAATNELVWCPGTAGIALPCGDCVADSYARYKYLFRNTPMNSSMLFSGMAGYLKYVMASKLMPYFTGYAAPLKIAVITEALAWCDTIHFYLAGTYEPVPGIPMWYYYWNILVGMNAYGNVTLVYDARVSPVATTTVPEVTAAKLAGANLIVHSLSGPVGRTFAVDVYDSGIDALLGGIDVPGQEIPLHWEATGGKCNYETFIATSGTRTPISPALVPFYDAYMAEYGHAPLYTSYGAYDTVIGTQEMVEAYNKWPIPPDERVPLMEATVRQGMMGLFKYTTGYSPYAGGINDAVEYDATWTNGTHDAGDLNPGRIGLRHELFHTPAELGPDWYPPYYARGQTAQWQNGRLEIFYPRNMLYSKRLMIPPTLYSHADFDVFGPGGFPDGAVDGYDLAFAMGAWLTTAGTTNWVWYAAQPLYPGLNSDQDRNGIINIGDISTIAKESGYSAPSWPL